MQKINNIAKATFTADEAGEFLPLAAKAAIDGKAKVDEGKAKGAAALAVMIAGFASDTAASRVWTFDIMGKEDVHTHVECTGVDEFGNDDLTWKRNGQGAVSKVAQSAYKTALQNTFFNLPQSVPAVWTMASKAILAARAIREEGMTATIEDGALKLSGGSGDRAAKMRDAKSLGALDKAAKGEAGSNRTGGHGAAKGEDGEARIATPAEIMALAARLVEGAAKGEEALSNTALSFARKIAALVTSNAEAFAEA
jgi:hypothetical protein